MDEAKIIWLLENARLLIGRALAESINQKPSIPPLSIEIQNGGHHVHNAIELLKKREEKP